MFKRYYKEAFNDIQPNREIINTIFEKASEKNKPKLATIYKYGTAFAALLVLAVSVYSYPKITQYATTKNLTAQTDDKEKNIQNIPENIPLQQQENMSIQKENGADISEENINYKTDDVVNEAPKGTEENAVIENSTDSTAVASDVSQNKSSQPVPTEAASSGGGSGGNSSFDAATRKRQNSDSVDTVIWSIENYCSYLGLNILNGLDIPSDLQNTTGKVVYVDMNGEKTEKDLVAFSFEGNDRTVLIETSKLENIIDYDKSTMIAENIDSVDVYFNNIDINKTEIYFKYKNVNFKIYTNGLSDEEIENIVKSITRL